MDESCVTCHRQITFYNKKKDNTKKVYSTQARENLGRLYHCEKDFALKWDVCEYKQHIHLNNANPKELISKVRKTFNVISFQR